MSTPAAADSSVTAEVERCLVAGNYGEALAAIDRVLALNPTEPALQISRGTVLHQWGRHREARDLLLKVEGDGRRDPAFYQTLGLACLWSGDTDGAERCMRLGVEQAPESWEHLFGLGIALYAQRRIEDAQGAYMRALELNPDDPHCLANLVSCDIDLGNPESAERLARRMVEVHPDNFVAWSNLGVSLDRQLRYDEAIAAFGKAAEIAAARGEAWDNDFLNHSICLLRAARVQDAIELLESHLPRNPNVQAHCHYSLALLLSGRMKEGWDQFEFRWLDGPLKAARPNFVKPAWTGQALEGKTILIRSEQGYGDFFQFIRYAPLVKAQGAQVLLTVPELARGIADGADGIDEVLKPNRPYPHFDFYVDLLSLPRIFGTDLHNVPCKVPYLQVDAAKRAAWEARIGGRGRFNVGLAWAGSPTHLRDKNRSISLEVLEPLAALENVTFYSLQKGPAASEARSDRSKMPVVDLEDELRDFVDTAALIDVLDLVICVDTSVAHLAGALGKPVWVMLPKFGDWRWLEGRDDSIWYPSMRLFRQEGHGDWSTVVHAIGQRLDLMIRGRTPSSAPREPVHERQRFLPRVPELPTAALSAATQTRCGYLQYLPGDEAVGRSIALYGEYLQQQLDLLGRIVLPSAWVVEAGAGIGVHAIPLANSLASDAHVFLYENRPVFRAVLRQNLVANSVRNVTVMKTALRGLTEDDRQPAATAPSETIDALRLERLDLLKIFQRCDPLAILDGASDTIWRQRPRVFSEVSDISQATEVTERMREFGYRSWRMETPLFSSDNFNRQERNVFAGQKALAVLCLPEEIDMDIALGECVEMT